MTTDLGRQASRRRHGPAVPGRAGTLRASAVALYAWALVSATGTAAHAAERLPELGVERAAIAGMSSGGAMAVQLHVAHSATFTGAAVLGGVPYDCALGSVVRATTICMKGVPTAPDWRRSTRLTEARARSGALDPTEGLSRSRVYLFSGTRDSVVRRSVSDTLHRYYRRYVPAANILYDNHVPASHAWVSPASDRACDATGAPYIVDCGIDIPGRFLVWLFGAMTPKTEAAGRLLLFDQREFTVDGGTGRAGLDESGWVYVPEACEEVARRGGAAGCRLLVALHGCLQGRHRLGDTFVRQAGLNEWAESNRIVVLYPQASATTGANPNGCWDWWGHVDADYATRRGVQVRAIMAMVARVQAANPGR